MVSWKTTLMGILAILPQFADTIIPAIPPKYQNIASLIFGAIGLYFAKDKDTTGAQQ